MENAMLSFPIREQGDVFPFVHVYFCVSQEYLRIFFIEMFPFLLHIYFYAFNLIDVH